MKIKSITVSNFLSFPYIENFPEQTPSEPTIVFNEKLNILVGPNGSGKSNLIEIINTILQQYFFRSLILKEEFINNHESGIVIQVNHPPTINAGNLSKHFSNKHKPAFLEIEFVINDNDKKNFQFISDNYAELQSFSQKYARLTFLHNISRETISSLSTIKVQFQLNENGGVVSIGKYQPQSMSIVDEFVHHYFVYFNVLQKLVEYAINLEGKKDWNLLDEGFLLIPSTRTYNLDKAVISYGTGLSQQILANQMNLAANTSTRTYSTTNFIFDVIFAKFGKIYQDERDQSGKDSAISLLQNKIQIIASILDIISLSLEISQPLPNDTFTLSILNKLANKSIRFNELSTGQKSIFYLIFAIYGLDFKNSSIFIDEPELHLHPSLQKKYFGILKKASKELNLQIILATHSPVFIDEETIENTYRLYKKEEYTQIIPPSNIEQQQKDLLQILTYTNSARIFFADKVVLVEGASDEYFFKFFYENYFLRYYDTNEAIEIIHITGKNQLKKWREFLDKFKIKNCFIGDFDNIKEHNLVSNYDDIIEQGKASILEKIKDKISDKTSEDGKTLLSYLDRWIKNSYKIDEEIQPRLVSLWEYLLKKHSTEALKTYYSSHPDEQREVQSKIEKKYKDGIYILKQGDLEEYLGISKDIQNIIKFCQKDDFEGRIDSGKLEELKAIFKHILGL